MMIIQTTIDQKSMTALAKITRRTFRRGRSGPVRMFAWFVTVAELFLTAVYIRAGVGGWGTNMLLAGIMLSCILCEDYVNGAVGLRQISLASRTVNTTFKEDGYVHRTRSGESWRPYNQIKYISESEDYFALFQDKTHGQIYDKRGFTWGSSEEFREFIQRKTGLKIQTVGLMCVKTKPQKKK